MAPSTAKKAAPSMQQTRLNFKDTRRNVSAKLKPSKPTLVLVAASKAAIKVKAEKKWNGKAASDVSSVVHDESEPEESSEPEGTEPDFEDPPLTPIEPVALNPKDEKYSKTYKEAKDKMGNFPTIHGKNESKLATILRVFDMSYKYGPCVGVSRLERWERAKTLGLDPPQEIYDILTSKEGQDDPTLSQTVLSDRGI